MPALYAVTLFISATLLFLVQPMIAKMILPKFGGTPAVWNTCMVFFQALLLAGYSYAHITTTWLGVRKQAALQLCLLLVPALALPLAINRDPPGEGNPVFWLLFLLLLSVGVPFFVISTSAPLLQKWFANTGHPSSEDPYFLYAASNVGSMLSLILYPVWMEPAFRLAGQSWIWTAGYAVLVIMTAWCAVALWRSPDPDDPENRRRRPQSRTAAEPPSWLEKIHWVALAFVPSSLMIGVTTYMSTDIAAIPLIWVIPLGLYLLSFIIVFSKLPGWIHTFMVLSLPVLILLQMYLMLSETSQSMKVLISLHLATLFVVAMVCHGELARNRPDARYLTEFYLLMSLGGVLGGMFNALFAPVAFTTVIEYPLVMVIACLLMPKLTFAEPVDVDSVPSGKEPERGRWRRVLDALGWLVPTNEYANLALDLALPIILGLITGGLIYRMETNEEWTYTTLKWLQQTMIDVTNSAPELYRLKKAIMYGIPALLCYAFVNRPLRFGLGVGAIMLASGIYNKYEEQDYIIYRHRSFFGVMKLERTSIFHRLVHGTTLHGKQRINPTTHEPVNDWYRLTDAALIALRKDSVSESVLSKLQAFPDKDFESEPEYLAALEKALSPTELAENQEKLIAIARSAEPLTYYHRSGPLGHVFDMFRKNKKTGPLALIGLGTATTSAYGEPGQEVTYYEIDQAVIDIAQNPVYFSYWTDAINRGVNLNVVLGDARLSLKNNKDGKSPDNHFQLIVVDAFSSDAIPVHLITREAVALYKQRLAPGGIIAYHISNRYLNLEPVVANLAEDAGLKGIVFHDRKDDQTGKAASTWIMLAREEADFLTLRDKFMQSAKDDKPWYRFEDDARWHPDEDHQFARPKVGVWTDDFSNILSILGLN